MPKERVLARAPSNIAIVKYMGKTDSTLNLPENPSLSMTLAKLSTYVEIHAGKSGTQDRLVAEAPPGVPGEVPTLSPAGIEKFLAHFARIRTRAPNLLREFEMEAFDSGVGEIRTTNTFPHAAGIASSASSFAALTLAGVAFLARDRSLFRAKFASTPGLRRRLAALAREGSGSSIRSFEGPFVAWEGSEAFSVEATLPALSDLVVVVASREKKVSSREAHLRVRTSSAWSGRPARAHTRYAELRTALVAGDFPTFARIAEEDANDMHQLFETAEPAFSYRTKETRQVMEFLATVGAPYAATLDAGPNVHVIVPQSAELLWKRRIAEEFPQYPVLVDRQGTGAELMAPLGGEG